MKKTKNKVTIVLKDNSLDSWREGYITLGDYLRISGIFENQDFNVEVIQQIIAENLFYEGVRR